MNGKPQREPCLLNENGKTEKESIGLAVKFNLRLEPLVKGLRT